MATANSSLRISELDFISIRNNLKTYLKSQSQFNDFDFDGSGMSVLLDILAYNTHYMGFYLNMVGNEAFLDTAQLRSSIISHAKHLNYVPTSAKGAEAVVTVKVTPEGAEDNVAATMTMPKFTRFISEPIGGVNYVFSTTEANTVAKVGNSFTFNNLRIRQGVPVTQQFLADGNTKRFTLASANVDTQTIAVTVQESVSNSFTTNFTMAEDLTQLRSNSAVYFVEESSDANGSYTIYFGDGTLGKALSNGNIVIAKYLDTSGSASNKANNFSAIGSIAGYSENVAITSVSAAAGGSEKETIDSIRFRAPVAYSIQNRAVNKNDYEALLLKDYPNIESISVWSGEDNIPPVYGKVFISLKPKENYAITELEKERIKNDIIANRAILTVFPEILDPNYTYLLFKITVNYNPNLTSLSESEVKSLVSAAVEDFTTDTLRSFKASYRNSVLHSYIDDVANYILSSEIETFVQKRLNVTTGVSKNYTLEYGTPLYRGEIGEAMTSFPAAKVNDLEGIERQIFFEEVPQSFTGIDSIEVNNPGIGYTDVPTITITGDGFGATAEAKIVNGKISAINVTSRGSNYTRATVAITGGGEGYGATATAKLELRFGDIRTYYYKENGEKVIVNQNAGTIDYDTGVIQLLNLNVNSLVENDLYDPDVLVLNIKPSRDTIFQNRNFILDVDLNDPSSRQITMVAENG